MENERRQGTRSRVAVDLLIRHAHVVTMDSARRVIHDGAVAVSGREIVAVGADDALFGAYDARQTIDAAGAVVHPGFIECHTHVTFHLARGAFGDTMSFHDVEPKFFVPFLNALDDDAEHAAALLACLEMVGNGTTCFLEAGTAHSPDAVAAAAERIGMRGLVADPWLWDATGNEDGYNALPLDRGPASLDRALALLGTELRRNRDDTALVRGHVAVQGMGSASEELERAAKAAADDGKTILNQHQSYYQVDAATDDVRWGRHPLVHLEEIGVLDDNCVFAHMNILRDDEIEPIIRSGMSVAWCPGASMMWGVGGAFHGRHCELYHRGVNIALGSDSSNWGVRFDVGLQGYLAILTAREKTQTRTALVAEDALAMATINGAKAIGLEEWIGSLEPGKRADIVVRANDVAEAFPLTDPVSQLVYSARSDNVRTVVIDGRVVLDNRMPAQLDPSSVFQGVEQARKRVFDRMGYRFERDTPRARPVAQTARGGS
ncbi:MAG TPA: amidohydrolase family protein [Gaiellaceae bacterium]|nr:amidohydrolase family protein [Gaiellaceae bacterium]